MGFIRVRAASGPRHEFDAPEEAVAASRRSYVVLDRKPVVEPRPVKYVTEVPKPKPKPKPQPKIKD